MFLSFQLSFIIYYKIHSHVKLFKSLINKALYPLMPHDGLYKQCYKDFLLNQVLKYEIYSIFHGGSSTNHTGFSDPWFYYTFQHIMALAGHMGTGALKVICNQLQCKETLLH